jgi:hypothetical protein
MKTQSENNLQFLGPPHELNCSCLWLYTHMVTDRTSTTTPYP